MWHTIASVFIASTIIIYFYYKYAFNYWKKQGVPFIEPKFPLGSVQTDFINYIGQNIQQIYIAMKQKKYSYCGYYILTKPIFMPISQNMYKQVLIASFNNFYDRGITTNEDYDPMGTSIVTLSGEKWKKMREKLSPVFTAQKTKMLMPIMQKCADELDAVVTNAIQNGDPIEIEKIMKRYSVDIICNCAFGIECNCLKTPNAEFFHHANLIFKNNIQNNLRLTLAQFAPKLSQLFKVQLFNPKATEFFRNVVCETVEFREKNHVEIQDILNLLIKMKNNNNNNNNNGGKGDGLSNDQIAAQCFFFFIAGFETTSSILSYAMFELGNCQDIQDKVREEIEEVLTKYGGRMCYEVLGELKYTDAVIKETLRKYPPVTILNRIVTQDFKIPDSEITIKKGTCTILSILGIHYDPEYFPNPEIFNPNRFSDENRDKIPPFAYLPFGDGPHICPGVRFGMMEIKLCIASLISKFKFKVDSSVEIPLRLCSIGNLLSNETPILLTAEKLNIY